MPKTGHFCAIALLAAAVANAETVRGRITAANSSDTYGFWPGGAHVELTLMWLKKPVILNLWVRCSDEIGSVFFDATSESNGDRIERFDFGGWDGATCTVTVFDLEGGSRTRYLLNLRLSFDQTLERDRRPSRMKAKLTPIGLDSVPFLKVRLDAHRARMKAER